MKFLTSNFDYLRSSGNLARTVGIGKHRTKREACTLSLFTVYFASTFSYTVYSALSLLCSILCINNFHTRCACLQLPLLHPFFSLLILIIFPYPSFFHFFYLTQPSPSYLPLHLPLGLLHHPPPLSSRSHHHQLRPPADTQ